ncbi:MAG TPA: glycosyltransferase family 39 protein [Patescibacteria group bacterium]|nr:glycosyltransferase family 39 protein [Patescibacteria group bacterium]
MGPAILILLSSVFVFFSKIPSFPLRNWDEAWYAEIIKNMVSGKYGILMPFWNGRYYFDNAPLYFWLSTPVFKIFGAGEWQARFISATAAVFAAFLIFKIGKKLKDETTGFISALVFLTFGGVAVRFAHGNLDAFLICFFLASFYFYLVSEEKKIFGFATGALIGLGFLIKSWGIGLFPLVLIFTYAFFKDKKLPRNLFLIAFAILIFSSWWYFLGILKFGSQFINWYILNPSEGRLADPFANFSLEYFWFLVRDVGFWFFVPFAYIALKFKSIKKLDKNIIVPFLSLAAIFVFFLNFLSDKSDWYIIPGLALISLVIGYFGRELCKKYPKAAICLISLLTIAQILNAKRIENIYPDRSKVGAELGLHAKNLIPQSAKIILNDQDFTSFLFYSDRRQIYTLENKTPKENEWWILNSQSLLPFLKDNPETWIITANLSNLPFEVKKEKIIESYNNYYFLKIR